MALHLHVKWSIFVFSCCLFRRLRTTGELRVQLSNAMNSIELRSNCCIGRLMYFVCGCGKSSAARQFEYKWESIVTFDLHLIWRKNLLASLWVILFQRKSMEWTSPLRPTNCFISRRCTFTESCGNFAHLLYTRFMATTQSVAVVE